MLQKDDSIAIIYICTGIYTVFWKEFYDSFEKYFIPTRDKHYYVFSDSSNLYAAEKENVHLIFQENLGWPGNTLFRYKIILREKEELLRHAYIFFMNANSVCKSEIGEDFLPSKEGLLFVQHPGYYSKPCYLFPYDRNVKSSAYIPYFKGEVYVCGGVNGGKSNLFIQMCEELSQRIDEDYGKGIIARWHDESQINRYVYELSDGFKLMPPSYCYPEFEEIPFTPIIVVRDKSKYFDVKKIKGRKEKKPMIDKMLYLGYRVSLLIGEIHGK